MTAHTGFRYVGEWDSFKATYHRRLAKILIDMSASTFRLNQIGDLLQFYTKGPTPLVLTLDPPEKASLDFADNVDYIEEDLENYFQEKRLAAEKQQKRQAALAKLTSEEKNLLGIHEFKDVNLTNKPTAKVAEKDDSKSPWPYLNYDPNGAGYCVVRWVEDLNGGHTENWDYISSTWTTKTVSTLLLSQAENLKQVLTLQMSEEAEVERQKHPEGIYLVDRADGVPGHFAVGRWIKGTWKYQGHQEVWNTKMNGWASCCSEVLSLEEATKLMNELNAKNLG